MFITIGDVIAYVDTIKPNTRTQEEKISWLNDIDTMIKEDIIDTHEDAGPITFNGYNEDTPLTQNLLVPAHYGRGIYSYYLMMQIDFINAEYTKYNTNASMFQSAFDGYATHYHNRHMPLQPNSINYGNKEATDYGNPLSDS